MKKSNKIRVTLIVVAAVAALIAALLIGYNVLLKAMIGDGVADHEKRIEIWGETIPGNSPKSKLDDMNITKNKNQLLAMFDFMKVLVGEEYTDAENALDTFTYQFEIKGGYEKETYEDAPYIIPYLCEGSDSAVIVIPGGGYGYKSIHGAAGEGKDIALELNRAGVSAFVLSYRSNPYEYPIPQLDVQRAVRYVKYHAEEFHLDPDKIGLIGFSAGGNQVGSYINLIMGKDLLPSGYQKDSVDMTDDSIAAPAMIYPALTYNYNVPMLFCSFDAETVRNETERERLLNETDLKQHINPDAAYQFVSYGTNDGMVGMDGAKQYIAAAREQGISVTEVAAEGQDHGYGFSFYSEEYIPWLLERLANAG